MNEHENRLIQERINHLWENTDFSSTLFESLVGYAVIAGDFDGNILAYNQGAKHIYGYDPDEIVGRKNITSFFPRDFIEAAYFQQLVDVLLETGRFSYEGEKVRKNGDRFPAQILWTLTKDKTGKVAGFVEIVEDISQRKQAEEALKRTAAELARSNRELEQFAYVASHDLREPLRVITIYLQRLERRCLGRLDADVDQFIAIAADTAVRMRALIHDLLAFARLGSRAMPFEPIDCAAVCNQAMANLAAVIQESGAVVTHSPLPTVRADGTQLVQLFQNLLSNAIKFRGQEPPRVHVEAAPNDGAWLFAVRDNGIGIDPKYAEGIFVIFRRLHARQDYPGTGIGLAICKKIVELHGGRIWVQSNEGQGATFWFTLPGSEGNQP